MSTKITISYDENNEFQNSFHLFQECYENNNVWLEVQPKDWSFLNGELTLSIPIKVWRKIVADWLETYWADHPEEDNIKPSLNELDDLLSSLEGLGSNPKIGE